FNIIAAGLRRRGKEGTSMNLRAAVRTALLFQQQLNNVFQLLWRREARGKNVFIHTTANALPLADTGPDEQVGLGHEVMVERPLGHARLLADLRNTDIVVIAMPDQLDGYLHEVLTRINGGGCCHVTACRVRVAA